MVFLDIKFYLLALKFLRTSFSFDILLKTYMLKDNYSYKYYTNFIKMKKIVKKIFIICPVRDITEKERRFIENHISNLEAQGHKVHYPPRDTNQNDPVGLKICFDNRNAIRKATEIHVYWNGKSSGSLFDLGMSFMYGKLVFLINKKEVEHDAKKGKKSFQNFLLALDKKSIKLA